MNRIPIPAASQRNTRRIGRKVIACGRTLNLLEAKASPRTAKKAHRYTFKRWHLAIPGAILLLIAIGFGATSYMHAQQLARVKAAAVAQNARDAAVAKKAEECRAAKVKEKSAALGKITYDQLYDNGACDF
jgi:uncharacterized protein HemX